MGASRGAARGGRSGVDLSAVPASCRLWAVRAAAAPLVLRGGFPRTPLPPCRGCGPALCPALSPARPRSGALRAWRRRGSPPVSLWACTGAACGGEQPLSVLPPLKAVVVHRFGGFPRSGTKNPFGSELGLNRWARDAPARNPGGDGRGSSYPRPWCHSPGSEELLRRGELHCSCPNPAVGKRWRKRGGAAGRSPPAATNNGSHSIVWCCGRSLGAAGMQACERPAPRPRAGPGGQRWRRCCLRSVCSWGPRRVLSLVPVLCFSIKVGCCPPPVNSSLFPHQTPSRMGCRWQPAGRSCSVQLQHGGCIGSSQGSNLSVCTTAQRWS